MCHYHDALALPTGGGREGLRSYAGLESAINQPQATFDGNDLHATIAEKAAAYGYFIAEAQAFFDGNKRTAVIAMVAFLIGNSRSLVVDTDDEIEEMFRGIGSRAITKDDFFRWVVQHVQAIEGS